MTPTPRHSLRRSRDAGARGLKVWKDLGLGIVDAGGALVLPDDPRLAPVYAAAGELGLPVLIHTADPVAFWDPVDGSNERLEELLEKPDWSFFGRGFPSFDRLSRPRVARRRAPGTTFIVPHVGCLPREPRRVDRMLTTYPNCHRPLAAHGRARPPAAGVRAADRQAPGPRALRHRLVPAARGALPASWYRFFESDDEYFSYAPRDGAPPQGRWAVSALNLPADVLEAVYRTNAQRVLKLI